MNKKRFIASVIGTCVFLGLMLLFDKFTNSENFMNDRYWPKFAIMGVVMFAVYFFGDKFKDLTWKDLFAKNKKNDR